jgi:methylmalonyl-CoA epimerase
MRLLDQCTLRFAFRMRKDLSVLTDAIRRIDHVAVVVSSLRESLCFYHDVLGLEPSRIIELPGEGVKIAFLPMGGQGGSEIELLEASDTTSGVARFLEKRGAGLHHICLEVPDIDKALTDLKSMGIAVLDEVPRPTAEGRGIFVHPRAAGGVLLELVQRDSSAA